MNLAQRDARVIVEEAMTAARVRNCPRCKVSFYKIEGCNKMTCSCGAKMCYICRKDITVEEYKHFNAKNLCQLMTNSVEDDRLAMYEAGIKTIGELNNQNENSGKVDITIDKLLEGGINGIKGIKSIKKTN